MGFLGNCKDLFNYLTGNQGTYIPPTPQAPIVHVPSKPKLRIPITVNRPWYGIVWHHSASPDSQTHNDWEAIRKYHMSYRIDGVTVTQEEFERRQAVKDGHNFEKPWRDIAYNGGIEYAANAAGVPELHFNWGRSTEEDGAHAGTHVSTKFNKTHLGLCAIGNFDLVKPNDAEWQFALMVTRDFMDAYKIPAESVIGHREVYDQLGIPREKTCPGSQWDMDQFRREL